jgi:hypothetical protein
MNSQDNSWQKTNPGGIIIPDFKLRYRGIAIKTAWCWQRNKYEEQWNRIENPDMKMCGYTYLICHKAPKTSGWL